MELKKGDRVTVTTIDGRKAEYEFVYDGTNSIVLRPVRSLVHVWSPIHSDFSVSFEQSDTKDGGTVKVGLNKEGKVLRLESGAPACVHARVEDVQAALESLGD